MSMWWLGLSGCLEEPGIFGDNIAPIQFTTITTASVDGAGFDGESRCRRIATTFAYD